MAEGDCIKPRAMGDCPILSQEIISQIIRDMETQSFRIVRNSGSYSFIDNERNTIIKVVCTYKTRVMIPGLEVGVFFRAELIDQIFLENVNLLFPTLRIRNNLYTLGGGLYRDYYLTVIDSIETYNTKRNEIFELSNVLLNPIKYFGYGSNMNFKQMQERCPKYKFISKAYLDDYKFVYDGYSKKRECAVANVIADNGNKVWGGIFEITRQELNYLNDKEGFYDRNNPRNSYDRDLFRFYFENKEPSYAFIYHREGLPVGTPSKEYRNIIIEGAKDFGLPKEYINNNL